MGPWSLPLTRAVGSSSPNDARLAFVTVQRSLFSRWSGSLTTQSQSTAQEGVTTTSTAVAGTRGDLRRRVPPAPVHGRPTARRRTSLALLTSTSNRDSISFPCPSNVAVANRHFSSGSSSTNSSNDPMTMLHAYLERHDVPVDAHDGMLKALKSAYGRVPTVTDLQSLGPNGLQQLADAVMQEQQQHRAHGAGTRTRPFVSLRVSIPHHKTSHDNLKWKCNESILDVTKNYPELLGEYIEGTCGGQMSCCTCHVYVSPRLMQVLVEHGLEVSESEQDMLDLAYDCREGRSRLGCQVVLTEDVLRAIQAAAAAAPSDNDDTDSGNDRDALLTITIPAGVNNVWK